MSAIVNDRDLMLQAASPRLLSVTLPDNIIIPAVKALTLSAPALTFKVSETGVASPSSITLTTALRQISGAVSFSVTSGMATLTYAGFGAVTLAYAGMSSESVTVRASVTEGGTTYTSDLTIVKVRDGITGSNGSNGTNGTNGSNGTAGAAHVTMASARTSAAAVTTVDLYNAIATTTGRVQQVGDAVTLHNQAYKWSQAWVYDGWSWSAAVLYIDGNAVITGVLYAGTLSTSKVVIAPIGSRIHESGITITGGELTIDIATTSLVATPLWSYASYPPMGVILNVYWTYSTSTSVSFTVRAYVAATGAAYSGPSGSLKIWFF